VSLLHHLLNRHTLLYKDGALIVMCGHRCRRGADLWYQAAPDAPWEQVDDVDALIARL
jgi:hypothetical protein